MATNEFNSPVSIDFAPEHCVCEWCGKPAEYELTAIGGKYHNMSALFCYSCGQEFYAVVAGSYDLEALIAKKKDRKASAADTA
jgi:hypothetical protein